MSSKLYIGAAVSYEEKGQWVYLVANVVTYGAYLAILLGQSEATALEEIDYVPTMLWAIGIAIALSIGGRILIEILRPSETYSTDVRDRDIGRLGEYIGGTVLGIAMLVPFALTLAEVDHFWIANTIYLAFALSAFVGTSIKVIAYRRGL
jgi:drug/metabolite transporter (DMT)-like permease